MSTMPTFMGGLLLGLAGSLHCAGICGGIASATLLAAEPRGTAGTRAGALMQIQLGRATTYTLAGGAVGAGSGALAGLLDLAGANQLLRVLAAANLLWVGAALAGIGAGPRLFDGWARAIGRQTGQLTGQYRRPQGRGAGGFAMGAIWGLMPCGMVYAALLTALLSGSTVGGALVMAGFALGTMPAVAGSAYGIAALAGHGQGAGHPRRGGLRAGHLRMGLGVAIAAIGAATLLIPAPLLAEICLF
ncbi:sulfite exporter TauE/SafE family protein [Tistrella bauzanensis]|uniref:Sulfite exporter TauE/SafE family protein n=1 Tax=Tistrella arctica TaxID=3133430 RepID=A0ABU9YGK6_9PROT